MTFAGKDIPGGSAPANHRPGNPPLQRRVVSRLLEPEADEAAQQKLVYAIEGRQAVLVELNCRPVRSRRTCASNSGAFHAAFGDESGPPPAPANLGRPRQPRSATTSASPSRRSSARRPGSATAVVSVLIPMQQSPSCDSRVIIAAQPGSGPNGYMCVIREPATYTG